MKKSKENNRTQLNTLQNFEYAETRVMAGKVNTGEMIALRPVSENLGLSWSSTLQALKRDSQFSQLCSTVLALGADGKKYEMACLPPDAFQSWLWSLEPSKYKNFNSPIWEEYKKGLVLHLLLMLRTALDHIQQTSEENYNNAQLRQLTLKKVELENKKTSLSSQTKEVNEELKKVNADIKELALKDPDQLDLFNNL